MQSCTKIKYKTRALLRVNLRGAFFRTIKYIPAVNFCKTVNLIFELASDAGAIYRIDGTVLINRDIFDAYLEQFHETAAEKGKEEIKDER